MRSKSQERFQHLYGVGGCLLPALSWDTWLVTRLESISGGSAVCRQPPSGHGPPARLQEWPHHSLRSASSTHFTDKDTKAER